MRAALEHLVDRPEPATATVAARATPRPATAPANLNRFAVLCGAFLCARVDSTTTSHKSHKHSTSYTRARWFVGVPDVQVARFIGDPRTHTDTRVLLTRCWHAPSGLVAPKARSASLPDRSHVGRGWDELAVPVAGSRGRGRTPATRQSITAMASTSTKRSGEYNAATPISVPGASSVVTPSLARARARPSPIRGILSMLQSVT
jgi:hypothetical protein